MFNEPDERLEAEWQYDEFVRSLKELGRDPNNVAARFLLALDKSEGMHSVVSTLKRFHATPRAALPHEQWELLMDCMKKSQLSRRNFLAAGASIAGGLLTLDGLMDGMRATSGKHEEAPVTFLGIPLNAKNLAHVQALAGVVLVAVGITAADTQNLADAMDGKPEKRTVFEATRDLCDSMNQLLATREAQMVMQIQAPPPSPYRGA